MIDPFLIILLGFSVVIGLVGYVALSALFAGKDHGRRINKLEVTTEEFDVILKSLSRQVKD